MKDDLAILTGTTGTIRESGCALTLRTLSCGHYDWVDIADRSMPVWKERWHLHHGTGKCPERDALPD